jgi:hypothetical protein
VEPAKRTSLAVAVGLTVVAGVCTALVLAATSGPGLAVPVPTFRTEPSPPIARVPDPGPELVIAQVAPFEPPSATARPAARPVPRTESPPDPPARVKPAPRSPVEAADTAKRAGPQVKGKAKGKEKSKAKGKAKRSR